MSGALPNWLTVVILLFFFLIFVVAKILNSKRKLTAFDFMTTTLQASLACGAMITGINLIVWCASGELDLPQTLLEPLHPLLAAGFFLIALCLWVVYRNLRGLWKKR